MTRRSMTSCGQTVEKNNSTSSELGLFPDLLKRLSREIEIGCGIL
jgi:hypothetical protein